jgi:SAM-dependent methyltransferase
LIETHENLLPSTWVARFAGLVPRQGPVLDLACGSGRHARFFLARDYPVTALDRDTSSVADLKDHEKAEIVQADLEAGDWPLMGRRFAAIVVTNYLHRPLFPHLLAALEPDGVLIYETFALGNERFGRPRNPEFLLAPGELLQIVTGTLRIVAYEHGEVGRPKRAVMQRLCAVNDPIPGAGQGTPRLIE